MYIEFIIYTDGPKAGTMSIEGMLPDAISDDADPPVCNKVFPAGTRAIRWKDPVWGWQLDGKPVENVAPGLYHDESDFINDYWQPDGEGGKYSPEPVYVYANGLVVGPYEDPEFHFPLAGGYKPFPPAGVADRLVVQVQDVSQVEFLDEDLGPLPRPDFGLVEHFAAPPPPLDPCQVTPLFCGLGPEDFESVCHVTKLCPVDEEMEVDTLRARDLAAAAAQHLRIAAAVLGADGSAVGREYTAAAVRQARAPAEKARGFADAALRAQRTILKLLGESGGMPLTTRYATDAGYALGRGIPWLNHCLKHLDSADHADLKRAGYDAQQAYLYLAEAMELELRMKAWAIPAEARRSAASPATTTISGVSTIVGA